MNLIFLLICCEIEKGFVESKSYPRANYSLALEGKRCYRSSTDWYRKTAAFGYQPLEKIRTEEGTIQALVIAPTRELAVQSRKISFGKTGSPRSSSIEKQIKA